MLLIMESVKVMRSHGTRTACYLCMIEAVIDQGRVLLVIFIERTKVKVSDIYILFSKTAL